MRIKLTLLGCAAALLILATACSSTPAPTRSVPTVARATSTPNALPTVQNPPAIPANHVDYTQCLSCHQTGTNGAPRVPDVPDHSVPANYKEEKIVCINCHQEAK